MYTRSVGRIFSSLLFIHAQTARRRYDDDDDDFLGAGETKSAYLAKYMYTVAGTTR